MCWLWMCNCCGVSCSGVITVSKKLDRETQDTYQLTVTATDDVADRVRLMRQ